MSESAVAWVVPCFNEAKRLDQAAFVALLHDSSPASLVLVDDGSGDETLAVLRVLAQRAGLSTEIVALPKNRGKAEAVRQGLRRALDGHAEIVGYIDADLSTPPRELARLATLIRNGHYDLLMGSRVQLLGCTIERSHLRHYLGRVFATAASLSLRLPVYDTQCGAKLFRRTPALIAALAQPFTSRWAFDVELIARLLHPPAGLVPIAIEHIREEPLLAWADVPGSKLKATAALRSGIDLLRLGSRFRRWRRG
jgi:glycosyltransferase involved in cell wall biosynthesis